MTNPPTPNPVPPNPTPQPNTAGPSPIPFRRVLVPVEGSRQAAWAASAAARLAAGLPGCRLLLLLHVVEYPVEAYYGYGGFEEPAATRQQLIGRGQRVLNEHADACGAVARPELRIAEGQPVPEIVAIAREWAADLIVMGAHARSRLAAFVFGSTTEGVIRHAHCPVLVIAHDPAAAAATPPAESETAAHAATHPAASRAD